MEKIQSDTKCNYCNIEPLLKKFFSFEAEIFIKCWFSDAEILLRVPVACPRTPWESNLPLMNHFLVKLCTGQRISRCLCCVTLDIKVTFPQETGVKWLPGSHAPPAVKKCMRDIRLHSGIFHIHVWVPKYAANWSLWMNNEGEKWYFAQSASKTALQVTTHNKWKTATLQHQQAVCVQRGTEALYWHDVPDFS